MASDMLEPLCSSAPASCVATGGASSSTALRTVHITVASSGKRFEVALLGQSDALTQAVATRSGANKFYLTAQASPDALLIPLTADLPDKSQLTLHAISNEPAASEPAISPAPAAARARAPVAPELQRQMTTGTYDKMMTGLERLNRLSTDLANERTFLAWVRTCMSTIRTVFTYLALTAATDAWRASVLASEIAMATLVVATAVTGAWRFYKIKSVISLKVPPANFGRYSLRPLTVLVVLTAVTTACGIWTQQWEKKK